MINLYDGNCFECGKILKQSNCKCLEKYNICYIKKSNYINLLYISFSFINESGYYSFGFQIDEKIDCEITHNTTISNYQILLTETIIIDNASSFKELAINLQAFCNRYLNNLIFI